MKIGIGVFSHSAILKLVRAKNGGWIVYADNGGGMAPDTIGAYSTAKDMIDALSEALVPIEIDLPSDIPS